MKLVHVIKIHKLPFFDSTLQSTKPLQVVYTDDWGPSRIISNDGFRCYISFIDHFTRHMWLYSVVQKSDVLNIFPKFKALVEKRFQLPIITMFSNDGWIWEIKKKFFSDFEIQHFKTSHNTLEHNVITERRHKSITETNLRFLDQAYMHLEFWPQAFQTAVYLLNRLPFKSLNNLTPLKNYSIKNQITTN